MATLIDERPEDELEEQQEETTEPDNIEESLTEETPEPEEDDLPEKYRGKSKKEIARMHQEAEKLFGRQSQEVGELRNAFDSYVQTQLASKAPEPEEDIDFFTDPDKAVAKAISQHPSIRQAEAASLEMKKTTAKAALEAKHPDLGQVVQDPAFGEWVMGSNVRKRLFQQADKQYDYESADELISLWKERKGLVGQTAQVEEKARKEQVKRASTGNTRSSSESPSRKVYRRADIIKLMKTDPDRYEMLAPEIMEAYRTGRVR